MEDQEKQPPLEFANQVVSQFAENLLGGKSLKKDDFMLIRLTFRKLGGSWFNLCLGDIRHLILMTYVVRAWGKQG